MYAPDRPSTRPGRSRACAGYRPAGTLTAQRDVTVGGKPAKYLEWSIPCGADAVVQRVWFVPSENVLVADEWHVPGLESRLQTARWY